MPLYTYFCQACDEDHEKIVSIDVRDSQKCPGCDNRLIRAIDRPGLVWAPTSGKGMR